MIIEFAKERLLSWQRAFRAQPHALIFENACYITWYRYIGDMLRTGAREND